MHAHQVGSNPPTSKGSSCFLIVRGHQTCHLECDTRLGSFPLTWNLKTTSGCRGKWSCKGPFSGSMFILPGVGLPNACASRPTTSCNLAENMCSIPQAAWGFALCWPIVCQSTPVQVSGVQNCVVFSCREIKPYGRPYAKLTFFYVLLTVTHVCMAILTLCLRRRYASPLWSHMKCCCKTRKET